jgi:Protein of unknown function (DUF3995)
MLALPMSPTCVASGGFLTLAGLHVVWATGSSWPLRDEGELLDQVVGRPGGTAPSPAACLAVAGALTTAAALVSGRPRRWPWLSRAGSAGVVAALATRGALGIAGRTDALVRGSSSQRFRDRDRRVYGPICLTLAALSAPACRR